MQSFKPSYECFHSSSFPHKGREWAEWKELTSLIPVSIQVVSLIKGEPESLKKDMTRKFMEFPFK